MSRTLSDARKALVAAIHRDSPGAEQSRLLVVLDALTAWSAAQGERLTFRCDEGPSDVMSFALDGSKVVFWSVRMIRGEGPKLEIYPPTGRLLSDELRADVLETLNAHSRETLEDGDRLRIGFGALKNVAARTAVLALMDRLLADSAQPAATPA